MRCESEFNPVTLRKTGCQNEATTMRRTRPWPPSAKTMWRTVRLCDECVNMWDETRAEAAWEARVS